jgi:hypothetical protein
MKLKFLGAVFLTFVFMFWPLMVTSAKADDMSGLTVDVYTYDSSILPDRQPYELCATDTVWTSAANINTNFDAEFGGIVAGCQGDFVLVHYTGFLTSPVTGSVVFQSYADDGFWMSLDDVTVIDNWWLKGCSGSNGTFDMVADQSYKLDVWFYEYGGGACNSLYWDLNDNQGMNVVPDSAYSTDPKQIVPIIVPPVVEPPVVEPPVVEPPVVEPPVVPVDPPIDPPPVVIPPVVVPDPVVIPDPVVVPSADQTLIALTSIAPADLTDAQVAQIVDVAYQVLDSVPEDSPQYAQALDALYSAAQADDIVVDASIANIPAVGAVAVALTSVVNVLGNIGSDMSPAHRATAKKEVVAAVVVTQIAVGASGMATQASISSTGSGGVRKRNE